MLWPEMMSLAHMMRSSVVQQDWVLPAMKSVGDNWASWTVTSFVMQPIRQCFSIGILYLQILIWRQQVTDEFVHREMHLWRNTSLNTILASWPSASPSPTHFQCTKNGAHSLGLYTSVDLTSSPSLPPPPPVPNVRPWTTIKQDHWAYSVVPMQNKVYCTCWVTCSVPFQLQVVETH